MDPVSLVGVSLVAVFWTVLGVQDWRTSMVSPVWMYVMLPFAFFYTGFGFEVLGVLVLYLFLAAWAWVRTGVSTGDVFMVLFYGLTTANNPVFALQVLLITAGSTMIAAEKVFGREKLAFAPVFTVSFLVTQIHQLFWL